MIHLTFTLSSCFLVSSELNFTHWDREQINRQACPTSNSQHGGQTLTFTSENHLRPHYHTKKTIMSSSRIRRQTILVCLIPKAYQSRDHSSGTSRLNQALRKKKYQMINWEPKGQLRITAIGIKRIKKLYKTNLRR